MKKTFIIFVALIFLLGVFVFHIMRTTGFFRNIEEVGIERIVKKIPIVGAEDIVVDRELGFAIISSDDRASRREHNEKQGALYYLDLSDFSYHDLTENLKAEFYPHGISMFQKDSNHFVLHVINHVRGDHKIEVFDLFSDSLVHRTSLEDISMVSPNDIISIDGEQFYFSNDHGSTRGFGRFLEDYLGYARSNVIFYNGQSYIEVAENIAYANGIQVDFKRNLLFLASPRDFLIKVYNILDDHLLEFEGDILCGTGVDNIEFDDQGSLWVGCHPNLLAFASYAAGKRKTSPSEIIKIDYLAKGNYDIEQVYMDDGSEMSASTVAANSRNYILMGNVMDEHLLVLKN